MAEEYTLRHTGQEIDDLLDNVPADSKASGIYKSSLDLSTIINEGRVTQDHLTEINSIYLAWKSGRMVYVLDEKGGYYNLGVLNMQLAEDNSKCSFVALDQSGVLCYYSCNPSSGVTGKWSVTPIGKDLFAMIEHTHIASDITEVINRRFMTDEQKTKLDDIDLSQYAKSNGDIVQGLRQLPKQYICQRLFITLIILLLGVLLKTTQIITLILFALFMAIP